MSLPRSRLLLLLLLAGALLAGGVTVLLSFSELHALARRLEHAAAARAAFGDAHRAAQAHAAAVEALRPAARAGAYHPLSPAEAPVLSRAETTLADLRAALAHLETALRGTGSDASGLARLAAGLSLREPPSETAAAAPALDADASLLAHLQRQRADLYAQLHQAEQGLAQHMGTHAEGLLARLAGAAHLLLAVLAIAIMLAVYGTAAGLRSDASAARNRGALAAAEASLRLRSDQLDEAQRLGKLGEWRHLVDGDRVELGPTALALLRLPSTPVLSRDAVEDMLMEGSLHHFREVRTEVLQSGEARTIDVRLRRGDGSVGDFALAAKPLTDADGRILGLFGTIQDITERKAAETQLESLAYYDPLTGLANRAMFNRELLLALARQERTGSGCALMLLDLDHFKDVNEILGHGAGDELLIKVGVMLWRQLGRRATLARLGGDEFAVILTESCEDTALAGIAESITRTLSATIPLERGPAEVSVSIGIVLAPRDGATASDLLRNADIALYKAKEKGRNGFVFFSQDLETAAQNRITLARDLRTALTTRTGLHVHYQPQLCLATGRIAGFEALVRWTHPERGAIPPSEFIPIAESSSLIADLGNWVLREAALQSSAWLDAGMPPREVSVNVSASQLWHGDFVADVTRILEETGLPAHLICLELTESVMVDCSEGRVRAIFTALKELGVRLALDDFGTDYSSLGYLAELPFDTLKIDGIFIHGCATSHRARELLKGVVALGRGLGMSVVAEGAECLEELDVLREVGCDIVQGFVFATALPPAQAQHLAQICERRAAEGHDLGPVQQDATTARACLARLRAARTVLPAA
ncbi:MAG: EAL domain-containing protein [Hyphomicrobiaceae bacterium]|nr:EAL domain-containing protein [Hyphomicrobiaceae bacterium]